jgi:hypothetical protein
MPNLLQQFRSLLPNPPLLVGEVTVAGDLSQITLPDGSVITARGAAVVGQMVFVRDGAIEGEAPDLAVVEITI